MHLKQHSQMITMTVALCLAGCDSGASAEPESTAVVGSGSRSSHLAVSSLRMPLMAIGSLAEGLKTERIRIITVPGWRGDVAVTSCVELKDGHLELTGLTFHANEADYHVSYSHVSPGELIPLGNGIVSLRRIIRVHDQRSGTVSLAGEFDSIWSQGLPERIRRRAKTWVIPISREKRWRTVQKGSDQIWLEGIARRDNQLVGRIKLLRDNRKLRKTEGPERIELSVGGHLTLNDGKYKVTNIVEPDSKLGVYGWVELRFPEIPARKAPVVATLDPAV